MTDLEKVRAEIERYIREEVCSGYSSIACCRDLLSFIDSMQGEHQGHFANADKMEDDELEAAAEEWAMENFEAPEYYKGEAFDPIGLCEEAFIAGANRQKSQMMNAAVEADINFEYLDADGDTWVRVVCGPIMEEDFGIHYEPGGKGKCKILIIPDDETDENQQTHI